MDLCVCALFKSWIMFFIRIQFDDEINYKFNLYSGLLFVEFRLNYDFFASWVLAMVMVVVVLLLFMNSMEHFCLHLVSFLQTKLCTRDFTFKIIYLCMVLFMRFSDFLQCTHTAYHSCMALYFIVYLCYCISHPLSFDLYSAVLCNVLSNRCVQCKLLISQMESRVYQSYLIENYWLIYLYRC